MSAERRRDRALVSACLEGDREAWAALVRQTSPGVRYAIVATLRSHGCDASDHLVDDIQSALYCGLMVDDARRLRQFRGEARVQTWLRVRAARLAIDHLRRRKRTVTIGSGHSEAGALDLPSTSTPHDSALAQQQLLERLRGFWEELPPADARFARLYFVEERTFDEIAEVLGTSPGALYARKNRIRKKLLAMAEQDGWFDHIERRAR